MAYSLIPPIDQAAHALAASDVDLTMDRSCVDYLLRYRGSDLSMREILEHADTIIDRAERIRSSGTARYGRHPWWWIGGFCISMFLLAWAVAPH